MTTAELKQYRNICAEIEDLENELKGVYVGDSVTSASSFPYSKHTVHIEGYKPSGGTVSKLARLSELKSTKSEIEEFVRSVKDYKIRKAIKIYYIEPIADGEDKPTWETVADKIGNGATSQTLKSAIKRFLKKRHTCHT